ncbi:unnamed protein product [Arabis nemorensis]|uniref:Cyclic nucleotide-binding domain-containing protein n=1 Tax=Arabis nemorensis TaxID=586526 RepID=A0A565BPL0_9BRAS|nr:unnamed protein product [Arabis nemorensis]
MLYVKGNFKKVYMKMKTLENWRKTVLFVCVAALAIDPLFFFIPVIDPHRSCLTFDKKLGVAVCVLRTSIDTFYVFHIIFYLISGLIAPRSQVSLRGEIFVHSKATRKRRFLFYFIVDVLSVLPIPQVCSLTSFSMTSTFDCDMSHKRMKNLAGGSSHSHFKEATLLCLPGDKADAEMVALSLVVSLKEENSSLRLLEKGVFGAFWYLGAIEKKHICWREACAKTPGCNLTNVYCTRESTDFPRKFFYCFWWGLRNLSALGQNLETSNSVGEIFFAIIICVSGLLLFAVLIGNVQKYLQSTTIRVDEMEETKRDTEKWMSNRKLPEDLKKRIRRYKIKKWRETRGTEEDAHLRSLPKSLIIETKRHLYLDFLKRVPEFQAFDDQLLDELCARLKTVIYTENSYIVREGDSLEEMFFVVRGNLMSFTTYGERNRFLLRTGDYCGDLLTWALDPHASHFPVSSRTIQALTEVEVSVLSVDDLKFVSTLYSRLHSKEVQHIFRYHSVQWRTWAACIIQVAWERHCRRKLSKALREEEGRLQNSLQNDDSGGNKLNLSAAIYALRFASHALKNLRANAAERNSRFPHMLSLLPQKPADPEFPILWMKPNCVY